MKFSLTVNFAGNWANAVQNRIHYDLGNLLCSFLDGARCGGVSLPAEGEGRGLVDLDLVGAGWLVRFRRSLRNLSL